MSDSRDFIFKKNQRGELKFVGDFEGLYNATVDPWDQSALSGNGLSQYYVYSRTQLFSAIQRRINSVNRSRFSTGLEIGCGHGFVVDLLSGFTRLTWSGVDISRTAITHAVKLFPKYSFYVGDITKPINHPEKYDVVVIGQMLWYILYTMPKVIDNCHMLLNDGGLLVVSQAFLTSEQKYGCDVADGFYGALKLLLAFGSKFKMIEFRYEDSLGLVHNDGLFILRKV